MSGQVIQFRRDTFAAWVASAAILSEGELAWDKDNGEFKLGNGTDTFANAPVLAALGDYAWLRQLRKSGVRFNVNADQTAAVQAAIDAYTVQGKRKEMLWPVMLDGTSLSLRIDGQISMRLPCFSVRWRGLRIDATHAVNASADTTLPYPMVRFIGQTVSPFNNESMLNECDSFYLQGPGTEGSNVDGVYFGDSSTVVGHSKVQKVKVTGFRDGWTVGDHTYITEMDTSFITGCYRRAYSCSGTVDAGERLLITGGSVGGNNNSTNDAVGIYMPAGTNMEVMAVGLTTSYTDIAFDCQGGTLQINTHFENGYTQPFGLISYTGGGAQTAVTINGGSIGHGALGVVTEPAAGRDCLFQVSGGERAILTVKGVNYLGFGRYATRFVRKVGGSIAYVSVCEVNHGPKNGGVGRICDETSLAYNGGFALGTLAGFGQDTGAGITMSVVNVVAAPEDGSTKMFRYLSTGTNSGGAFQTLALQPQSKFRPRCWLRITSWTAGTFALMATYIAADGTQIGSPVAASPALSAVADWTLMGNDLMPPTGAAFVKVSMAGNGFTGDANAYNFAVWTL